MTMGVSRLGLGFLNMKLKQPIAIIANHLTKFQCFWLGFHVGACVTIGVIIGCYIFK